MSRAMSTPQRAPRSRSPFAAAFLSLLFPGLGQWYAGATMRALAFAAVPILAIALLAGVGLRMDRIALLGLAFDPNVLNAVFVQTAFYLPRDARERGDLERAALFLSVASVVRPEDPQVWYRLAAAESRQGRRRQAVDALRRAVEKGFADGKRLEGDADFDRLREDPDFRGLAARLGR